jgi:hypothetical protein
VRRLEETVASSEVEFVVMFVIFMAPVVLLAGRLTDVGAGTGVIV